MQYETGEGVSYIESGSYVPEAPTLEGGSADVGTPCEFVRTPCGRPVGTRGPWRGQYDYVLFTYCWDRGAWGWAALAELQLTSTVDREGSRAETARAETGRADAAARVRRRATAPTGPPLGLPASPGTVPTALGRRRCTPPGSQALVHFCAHHTLVTAHTALSTTHGTVPVA